MSGLCLFAGRGRWDGAIALAMIVLAGLSHFCRPVGRAAQASEPPVDRVMFSTLLADLVEPGKVDLDSLPAEVRDRARNFQKRAAGFRSLLPTVKTRPGPEAWLGEKRREMERGIVSLVGVEGIEEAARDYAGKAVLAYEWEGMSDGPLAEAGFAEKYRREHPGALVEPYLLLFLAHRYRCASETLGHEGRRGEQASALGRYRELSEEAMRVADPLVRFVAKDMSARPYLYLEAQVTSQVAPGTKNSALSPQEAPALEIGRALALAEAFVREKKIDLSQQHIHSVTMQHDDRGLYWLVQWQWNMPRLGMEYGLRVYMDGSIVEARLGP